MKDYIKTLIAIFLYKIGRKPSISTFIDEDTMTAGYGKLDSVGCWEYDLPTKHVKKVLGYVKRSDVKTVMKIKVNKPEPIEFATHGDIIGISYVERDHDDDYYLLTLHTLKKGYLYDLGNGNLFNNEPVLLDDFSCIDIKDLQTYVGKDRVISIITNAELIKE